VKTLYDGFDRVTGSKTKQGVDADNNVGETAGTIIGRQIKYTETGKVENYRTTLDGGEYVMDETTIYGTKAEGEADRVYGTTLDGTQQTQYTYDHLGRITRRSLTSGGNFTTAYTYNAVNGNQTSAQIGSMSNGGSTLSYTYDHNGNILTISEGGVLKSGYEYDQLNQLIWEYDYANGLAYNCMYDTGGNITYKKKYPYTQSGGSWVVGALSNSVSYGYTDVLWKDLLTSYNGQSITYDYIGNPLTYRSGMTMTWSRGRQLQSIGNTASFTYNADGMRIGKTAGGVTHSYVYDGELIQEKFGQNTIVYLEDVSGRYYGFKFNGTMYYYVYNLQGDVIGILDNTGASVAKYTYDAWGKVLSVKDTNGNEITDPNHIGNINPIRYRGYYYDTESEFAYVTPL